MKTKRKSLKDHWVDALNGVLPKNERIFLKDPKFAYLYAKYIRKKPWNEKDEMVFYKDLKCAYLYCVFLANPPDHLHNFMIAKNLDNLTDQDKRWVGEYFDHVKTLQSKNNRKNKKIV